MRQSQISHGNDKWKFQETRQKDVLLIIAYKMYIQPRVEDCVRAWPPHLKNDTKCLERLQRAATKMAQGLSHLTYELRLLHLGLTALGECRTRGDLIETYKIMTGREAVEREQFFQLSACDYNLRGHSMSLSKQRACSLDVQSACGRERVKLAVTSTGRGCYVVNQFKNRLDKYRQRYMYCH